MITKKLWNSFNDSTRRDVIEIYCGKDFNMLSSIYQDLETPYNHDFDFDASGKKLKEILSTCYLQKDGKVNVVVSITPTYTPKTATKKSTNKQKPVEYKTSRWYIDYEDKSGDLCHIWVKAYDRQDAIEAAKLEYWDIVNIISVKKE